MDPYNFLRFGNEVFDAIRAVNPRQLGIVESTPIVRAGITPENAGDFVAALNRICETRLPTDAILHWQTVADVCDALAEELGYEYNADADGFF
jgi:hypothetical protein